MKSFPDTVRFVGLVTLFVAAGILLGMLTVSWWGCVSTPETDWQKTQIPHHTTPHEKALVSGTVVIQVFSAGLPMPNLAERIDAYEMIADACDPNNFRVIREGPYGLGPYRPYWTTGYFFDYVCLDGPTNG